MVLVHNEATDRGMLVKASQSYGFINTYTIGTDEVLTLLELRYQRITENAYKKHVRAMREEMERVASLKEV